MATKRMPKRDEPHATVPHQENQWQDGLGAFIGASVDAFILFDGHLNLLEINPAGRTLAGLSPETAKAGIGKNIVDLIPNLKESGRYGEYLKVVKTGKPYVADEVVPHPHLGDMTLNIRAFKVGKGLGIVASDISDRVRMERALQRSQDYFESLIANAMDVIVVMNDDGTIRYESPSIRRITGYTPEERDGKSVLDLLHPDDVEIVSSFLLGTDEAGAGPRHGEVRLRHKDGSWRHVEATIQNLLNDSAVEGIVANLRDVTEHRLAEERHRESEHKYRALFESTIDGIIVADVETMSVVFGNRNAARMYGFDSIDDAVGMSVLDFVHPDDRDIIVRGFTQDAHRERGPRRYHVRTKTRDGREIWTSALATRTRFEGRLAVLFSLRDITERKQAEREIQLRDDAIENALSAIAMTDMEGRITYANHACMRIWGSDSKEELYGRHYWEFLVPRDAKQRRDILASISNSETWAGELTGRRKDGAEIEFQVLSSVVKDEAGNPAQTISSFVDVTERKQASKALQESEEKFRRLVNDMNDGYCVLQDFKVVFANARSFEMFGYRPKEVIGKPIQELLPADMVEKAEEVHARRGRGERLPQQYETKLVRKDGSECPVEFSVKLTEYGGGPAMSVVIRDVGERKRMEAALKESEQQLRTITEEAAIGIALLYTSGEILYLNPAGQRMLGYSLEELQSMTSPVYLHPDDAMVDAGLFSEMVQGKRDSYSVERRLVRKNGEVLWVSQTISLVRDAAGEPRFSVAMLEDVSERKRARDELVASEERYRLVVENATEAIVVAQDGMLKFFNPRALTILGLPAEKLASTPFVEVIHPDDREMVAERHLRRIKGEKLTQVYPFRVMDWQGNVKWVEINAVAITWEGTPATLNFLNDITERRSVEEALLRSERRFRTLIENASDVIILIGSDGTIQYESPAVERMLGYKPEEVVGLNSLTFVHPDDMPDVIDQFHGILASPRALVSAEVRVQHKDGSWRVAEAIGQNLLDDPAMRCIVVNFRDITERKRADEQMREREEYFRSLIENAQDAIVVLNRDGTIRYEGPSIQRVLAFRAEERTGQNAFQFIHPDDEQTAVDMFSSLLQNPNDTAQAEVRALHADGSCRTLEVVGKNLLDHPAVEGIVANFRDITERKQAEEEIARHTRRVETLYEITREVSQTLDLDTLLTRVLDRTIDMMSSDTGAIYLLDLGMQGFSVKAHRGMPAEVIAGISTVKIGEKELQTILRWESPVTPLSQLQNAATRRELTHAMGSAGVQSFAAVPLSVKGELKGVIAVGSRPRNQFSAGDVELLAAIGNEIAVGIENARLLEKTRELSITDEVTGLHNRRHFYDVLDREMSRTSRYGRSFSMAMLDLDGFKDYNDRYGHTTGDSVLRTFAQALTSALRKTDMAFRYGGDEFGIILPSTESDSARRIVERIRSKWSQESKAQYAAHESRLGFSAGIAQFPEDAETGDGLVFLADTALFHSKRVGGNTSTLVSDLATVSADIGETPTLDQVYALAATVDARDPHTYGHSKRVATVSEKIGRAMGLPRHALVHLHAAGLLHDAGKVGVPDAILTKADKLVPDEWEIIRKHSAEGARIVSYVKELAAIVPMIRHHHEWYDGSGYPDGLKGEAIPLGARIISIADAYDTMTTMRPYREVVSHEVACKELRDCSGSQFDPEIVGVFIQAMDEQASRKQGA